MRDFDVLNIVCTIYFLRLSYKAYFEKPLQFIKQIENEFNTLMEIY